MPPSQLCLLSRFGHARLFTAPWTVAHQASLFKGFSRKEYCRRLPCLPPGDLSIIVVLELFFFFYEKRTKVINKCFGGPEER